MNTQLSPPYELSNIWVHSMSMTFFAMMKVSFLF